MMAQLNHTRPSKLLGLVDQDAALAFDLAAATHHWLIEAKEAEKIKKESERLRARRH